MSTAVTEPAAPARPARRLMGRSRLLVALASVGLVALVGALAWWALRPTVPTFIEYRVPTPGAIPAAIAAASDGTIWFTLDSSDQLGRVSNGEVGVVSKGHRSAEPLGLAVATDGALWFTDALAGSIARRAPDGSRTSVTLSSPTDKLARLAAAPDGSIWFADGTLNALVRIHDATLAPVELPTFRSGPFGVAVGADGTVWTTLQYVNKLARIAPNGEVTEVDLPTRQANPTDVAIDSTGAVWFAELRANKIGRYADGDFAEFPVPTPSAGVTGLAVAPDGAVWFTETRGHKLGRLRDGTFREFDLPRPDARPFGITVDRAGNVWYTDLSGVVGMLPADRASAR